jgi:putative ATP-binding cassette transporter
MKLPDATLVSIGHRSTLAAFHRRRIAIEPQDGAPAAVSEAEAREPA